jgi:integrase
MRKSLSDKGVAALKARAKRYAVSDPELRGLWLRVQPSGSKSYWAVARDPDGKQVAAHLGGVDTMPIAEARGLARDVLTRLRAGLPAHEPKAESFGAVVAHWRQRHVEAKGLRSAPEIVRFLDTHILPAWGARPFTAIRRSDVVALLDRVEDRHGARAADYTLNVTRAVMNWFATRSDDYVPPIVRGMRRQSPSAQSRGRILDDAELRALWLAAENAGTFGAILQLCLLTAQRSRKVSTMKWEDVSPDGEWLIARLAREKNTGGSLLLPPVAREIIAKQPRFARSPYVFAAARGSGPFRGFGATKASFDAKCGVAGWVIHDLRRSARSLLSRAGVRPEIAERLLGHAIRGVEGVYDRHSYASEKADALRRLAGLLDDIVRGRTAEIVPLKRGHHAHGAR